MPLLAAFRLLFALASLAILAVSAYLLWSWFDGYPVYLGDGQYGRGREDWRLWTGLGLLAWSFLGRFVIVFLTAKSDRTKPDFARRPGGTIVSVTGATLHYEISGRTDGPTVVLTHGWGLDSTIWANVKTRLEANYRVIAWDLAGLGRSTRSPHRETSLEAFAEDLGVVTTLAGEEPLILVGHSIGGMTIQTFARERPECFARRVAAVVLLNTTYSNPLKTMVFSPLATALRRPVIEPMMKLTIILQPVFWLGAWQSYLSGSAHLSARLGFGRYVTRKQLDHTALLTTRNAPGVQARGNLAMFRWDAGVSLSDKITPTLVIGGDMDIVTKLEASEVIAARTSRSALKTVTGVNHMGFLERGETYADEILAFLSSLTAAAVRTPQPTVEPPPVA